jgi:hypothetical protein
MKEAIREGTKVWLGGTPLEDLYVENLERLSRLKRWLDSMNTMGGTVRGGWNRVWLDLKTCQCIMINVKSIFPVTIHK